MSFTMRPVRKIERLTREAYRNAGFDVAESGRVIAPPRSLHPDVRPPGFSRLPQPQRGPMGPRDAEPAPCIPRTVKTLSAVPARLHGFYEHDPVRDIYQRTAVGTLLDNYRAQKLGDPLSEPIARRAKLTRAQWLDLAARAEAGPEREHFLRSAALQWIEVKED